MFKDLILEKVTQAIQKSFGDVDTSNLRMETPKNPEFGDFAVNVSPLARFAKMAPPMIAQKVVENLEFEGEVTVAGGFINFKLSQEQLSSIIEKIAEQKENYGKNNLGQGEKVLLEYVSANPTGPFHIGHGRWAAMGSALADLMKFSGYDVFQEFYINDAGSQMDNLKRSFIVRLLEQLGGYEFEGLKIEEVFTHEVYSKNFYPGEYLVDVAKKYLEDESRQNEFKQAIKLTKHINEEKGVDFVFVQHKVAGQESLHDKLFDFAKNEMEDMQRKLLKEFKVQFDKFFSETSLYTSGEIKDTLEKIAPKTYEKDDATWLKTTEYGDDQDRVLIKADGSYTYLTPDIAYHDDKFKRAERLINIWGADHHGYVCRMKAAMSFLGNDSDKLEVLLGQLVNLIVDGQPMRMGKRKKMYTLADLIEEVGVDATRFWMIMRSIDTTLDFDIDLAKSKSDENPVFYVQYAHARACSILRNAVGERFDTETKEKLDPFFTQEELDDVKKSGNPVMALNVDDEKAYSSTKSLILKLEAFEELVLNAAKQRAPYMLCRYAQELAADFHHFYTFSRVLNVEKELMESRLSLVFAFRQVLATTLKLLGVSQPQSM